MNPETVGGKLYGLNLFKELNLFRRLLCILLEEKTKDEIISKLKQMGFKDGDDVAIRFSGNDSINLPYYLGDTN